MKFFSDSFSSVSNEYGQGVAISGVSHIPLETISGVGLQAFWPEKKASNSYWVNTMNGMKYWKKGANVNEAYNCIKQGIQDADIPTAEIESYRETRLVRLDTAKAILSGVMDHEIMIYPDFGEDYLHFKADKILNDTEQGVFARFMESATPDNPIARTEMYQGSRGGSMGIIAFRRNAVTKIVRDDRSLSLVFNRGNSYGVETSPKPLSSDNDKKYWERFLAENVKTLDRALSEIRAVCPDIPIEISPHYS